ncbi:MAG: TonB-dependent receptor, partial [Woeseiaceae bacterium]
DFTGLGVEASTSMSEPGDAETYDFNLAYGQEFANGRGHLTVFANYYDRKPLFAADRASTATPYRDNWGGELIEAGSPIAPEGVVYWPYADLGNGPVEVTFNPDGTPREFDWDSDLYNYAPVNYLQIPLERHALGLLGQFDFSDRAQGYVEATFARKEPELNLAPVPMQLDVSVNLDNPVLTPETRQVFTDYYSYAPNLAGMIMGKRLVEVGPRYSSSETEFARIVAGVRGEVWTDWDFDAWFVYANQSDDNYLLNAASRSRIQQGLLVDPATNECYDATGGCVPLDFFGEGRLSQEGADFIRVPALHNQEDSDARMVSLLVSGSPFETWAAPVDVAIGFEWRAQDASYTPDPAVDINDTLAWDPGVGVDGSDEVYEVYGEAVIPLAEESAWAQYLGLEVGGRYSDYKYADPFWTYKVGGEWRPVDSLRLRAMRQHSVRAPTIFDLFLEQSLYTWAVGYDPCSASADPVGNNNVEKCVLQGLPADQIGVFEATQAYAVNYVYGGNQDLEPEAGDTWTVGLVLTPSTLSNLSVSVDYFSFELEDTIGGIDSMIICFDPANTGSAFCQNIVRDSTYNISQVTDLISNRGTTETTGVDTQIEYQFELPDFLGIREYSADLAVDIFWTHLLDYKVQENVVSTKIDCAGFYGWPCWGADESDTFAEDRVTANAHYSSGPLSMHLTLRWIKGSESGASFGAPLYYGTDPELAVPRVGDETYVDLGFSYEFSNALTARLGVTNLLDNDPPQMANQQWSNNTDTGIYDVFGRGYYLTLTWIQ